MTHTNLRFLVAVCAATIANIADSAESEAPQSTPAEAAAPVVLDRAEFIARLPNRVFVEMGNDDRSLGLRTGLRWLNAGQIDFRNIDPSGKAPEVTKAIAPVYPIKLRTEGVEGAASFLILVSKDGTPDAICCFDSTRPEFGVSGAYALKRWEFTAAKFKEQTVPAIVHKRLVFDLRK